ncbi:glycoside hydrolase family 17 protein [Backusella circina FSU 941]|nr:glycoside hydrolase family 17 protein [Backusella circina FSU 941]
MIPFYTILSLIFFTSTIYAKPFYGLNYGINRENCPSLEMITNDFEVLKTYTDIVRIYTLKDCNLGDLAITAAENVGLRLYLGMWVDRYGTFDQEFAALENIQDRLDQVIEGVIVGSEVNYRGDVPPAILASYIKRVKQMVQDVKVTTSDVYYKFAPEVVREVDYLMMNAFPYWEGVSIEGAASTLYDHYISAQEVADGKPVLISETGWPDWGSTFERSVPSPENHAKFLLDTLCMTRKHNIDMIWFSAMDEPYKPDVEAHFGLLDANRALKSNINYHQLINTC